MLAAQGYIAIQSSIWSSPRFIGDLQTKLTLRPANRRRTNRMSKEPKTEQRDPDHLRELSRHRTDRLRDSDCSWARHLEEAAE